MLLQAATERAYCALIERTMSHVGRLVPLLADAAFDERRRVGVPELGIRPCEVVPSACGIPDDDRGDERRSESDEGGKGATVHAKDAGVSAHGNDRGDKHGAAADRVDIAKVRALELDVRRTDAGRLENDEIGYQRADPGSHDDGVDA